MGRLVKGKWQDVWYDTKSTGGRFVRADATFRNWITADGSAGPTGMGGFKAEAGRYHLYVSYACPWAHRTLILRALKGLEDLIGVSAVAATMADDGWSFDETDGASGDALYGHRFLRDLYTHADADFSGRVTVPVLWDKATETIVSNESADIIRMLTGAFDGLGAKDGDYWPEALRGGIETFNSRIYDTVNNGVYKAGFATTQAAYEEAVIPLFKTLDWLEGHLSENRYLMGDRLTEADIRLFTTLVRFDAVYVGHFKCNIRRLADYPELSAYVRDIYALEGVAETVHIDTIKAHYYRSHRTLNPSGIIPVGPALDFMSPHGRDWLQTEEEQ